jgi:hypothetical protein
VFNNNINKTIIIMYYGTVNNSRFDRNLLQINTTPRKISDLKIKKNEEKEATAERNRSSAAWFTQKVRLLCITSPADAAKSAALSGTQLRQDNRRSQT